MKSGWEEESCDGSIPLQQQSADMCLFGIPADHANAVVEVGFGLGDRLPVDDPDQRPQGEIDENDECRRQRRV